MRVWNPDQPGSLWGILAAFDQGVSAFLKSIVLYLGNVLPSYSRLWIDAIVERPIASGLRHRAGVLPLYRRIRASRSYRRSCPSGLGAQRKDGGHGRQKRSTTSRYPIPSSRKSANQRLVALVECGFNRYALPDCGCCAAVRRRRRDDQQRHRHRSGAGAASFAQRKNYKSPPSVTLEPGQTFHAARFRNRPALLAQRYPARTGAALHAVDRDDRSSVLRSDHHDRHRRLQGYFLRHLLAWPIRRWWTADWFQPIAKIGRTGAIVGADLGGWRYRDRDRKRHYRRKNPETFL